MYRYDLEPLRLVPERMRGLLSDIESSVGAPVEYPDGAAALSAALFRRAQRLPPAQWWHLPYEQQIGTSHSWSIKSLVRLLIEGTPDDDIYFIMATAA